MRQVAKLPVETLSAGVLFARVAPTIATPIAERFDDLLKFGFVG